MTSLNVKTDMCTFVIIPDYILFRMRNISDKICRENQNTHFVIFLTVHFNIFILILTNLMH